MSDNFPFEPVIWIDPYNQLTIIGSVTKSREEILACRDYLTSKGIEFIHEPVSNTETFQNLYQVQLQHLKWMDNADIIVVVPKPDGSIGESTSYELAYAMYKNGDKLICAWIDGKLVTPIVVGSREAGDERLAVHKIFVGNEVSE